MVGDSLHMCSCEMHQLRVEAEAPFFLSTLNKLSPESPVLLSDMLFLRDRDPAPLMHI